MAPPRGERHPRAKLTDHETHLIVELATQGLSYRKIAEKFEISFGTVSDIVCGRRRFAHENLLTRGAKTRVELKAMRIEELQRFRKGEALMREAEALERCIDSFRRMDPTAQVTLAPRQDETSFNAFGAGAVFVSQGAFSRIRSAVLEDMRIQRVAAQTAFDEV